MISKTMKRSDFKASFPLDLTTKHYIISCLVKNYIELCKNVYIIIYIYAQHDIIISCLHNIISSLHDIISSYVGMGVILNG